MDASERKALEDIQQHGCHIIYVMAEDDLPPFAYTIGIQRTSHAPELIVIGLKQPIACFVLNEYNRRIRQGEKFNDGQMSGGFLEGFECQFQTVHRTHYPEYLGWAQWLYKREEFDTLQIVYPNTSGVWPWQNEADECFKSWQPILSAPK
jgi:Domain of unknown function (DUF4262)